MKVMEKLERTMYVIRRDDGKFYYKHPSISSHWGYKENFNEAHLFSTEAGARKRLFTADMNAKILPVKITLSL